MKKSIISVLAVVLVLTLVVGVAVACEQPATYTVTFKNGETTVSTVEVEQGKALTAEQIPNDPTPAQGKTFVGWYVGETKVTAGYTPTENVTAVAKFDDVSAETYTVTFKNGETTVKTVEVEQGQELTAAQIPSDPTPPQGQTFAGWYVGETKVTAGYKPTGNVTAVAKFSQPPQATKYSVTVAEGDYTVEGIDEDGYEAGDEVTFSVTVTDSEKLLKSVTSPDVTIEGSDGSYHFTMPEKNVQIVIELERYDELPNDERIELFMYGPMAAQNRMNTRSIYAKLKDGLAGEFVWTSSDPSIVTVDEENIVQGSMPEALLIAQTPGRVTITCTLASDRKVKSTFELQVYDADDGTAISDELYGAITGGVKLDVAYTEYNYDSEYEKSVNDTSSLTIIYEENRDYGDDNTYDVTDAYFFEEKDKDGTVTFSRKYVTYGGRYIGTEYIDGHNEVKVSRYENEEGESEEWDTMFYNIFGILFGPEYWKSFDGGQTYHFVGNIENVLTLFHDVYRVAEYSFFPDNLYLKVENGEIVELVAEADPVCDPAAEETDVTEKYGAAYVTRFTERGTAKIEHLQPYTHEDFHEDIESARSTMASLKQYKVEVKFTEMTYIITYLPDTIDVVTKNLDEVVAHVGVHTTDGGKSYYEYSVDLETGAIIIDKTHDAAWESDTVTRYPTFDFAAEIFEKTGTANTYISRAGGSDFVMYMSYMPTNLYYADWEGNATIVLDGEHIVSVTVDDVFLASLGTKKVTLNYSDFNTATVDLDFDSASEDDTPTTWEEASPKLYDAMTHWNFPAIPYVHPQNIDGGGWGTENGWGTSINQPWDAENYAYFSSDYFASSEARDAFIEEYKQALLDDGWTLCEEKDPRDGFDMYQKGDVKIAIGADGNLKVKIGVYSDQLTYWSPYADL